MGCAERQFDGCREVLVVLVGFLAAANVSGSVVLVGDVRVHVVIGVAGRGEGKPGLGRGYSARPRRRHYAGVGARRIGPGFDRESRQEHAGLRQPVERDHPGDGEVGERNDRAVDVRGKTVVRKLGGQPFPGIDVRAFAILDVPDDEAPSAGAGSGHGGRIAAALTRRVQNDLGGSRRIAPADGPGGDLALQRRVGRGSLIGDEGTTGDPDARGERPGFAEIGGVRELPGGLNLEACHAGEGDVGSAAAVRALPDDEVGVRFWEGRDAGHGVAGTVGGDREDLAQIEARGSIGRDESAFDIGAAEFDGLFPGDERAAAGFADGGVAQIVFGRAGEEELVAGRAGRGMNAAALDHGQPGLVELFPDDEEGAVGGAGADIGPVDRAGGGRIDGPEVRGLAGRVHGAGLDRGPRRPDDRPGGGTGGRGLGEPLVFARGGQGHDIARRCPVPVHDPRPDVAVVARAGSLLPDDEVALGLGVVSDIRLAFSRSRRNDDADALLELCGGEAQNESQRREQDDGLFGFRFHAGAPPRSLIRSFRRQPKGENDSWRGKGKRW